MSLIGLAAMAPGAPVECRLHHTDGTMERIALQHTFTVDQLRWFRAGSALNVIPSALALLSV